MVTEEDLFSRSNPRYWLVKHDPSIEHANLVSGSTLKKDVVEAMTGAHFFVLELCPGVNERVPGVARVLWVTKRPSIRQTELFEGLHDVREVRARATCVEVSN